MGYIRRRCFCGGWLIEDKYVSNPIIEKS